jgi:hypothetical protein
MSEEIRREMALVRRDIKEIKDQIVSINIEIAKQTVDWNHHVKRTDGNDKRIDTLQKFMWINIGGIAIIHLFIAIGVKYFLK